MLHAASPGHKYLGYGYTELTLVTDGLLDTLAAATLGYGAVGVTGPEQERLVAQRARRFVLQGSDWFEDHTTPVARLVRIDQSAFFKQLEILKDLKPPPVNGDCAWMAPLLWDYVEAACALKHYAAMGLSRYKPSAEDP